MKICPMCNKKYGNGNFCENCETPEGGPVKLKEEKKICPQCKKEYKLDAKFCSECGVKLSNEINFQVEKKEADNSRLEKHDTEILSDEVIIIPDGTTKIDYEEYKNNKKIKKVVIPDSVTKIGEYAFCDCALLISVEIPDSVTEIGKRAFEGCDSLSTTTRDLLKLKGYIF